VVRAPVPSIPSHPVRPSPLCAHYPRRRGLAFISKDRPPRIKAIAEYLATTHYDVVCLQELWIYKDFEIVREEVLQNLPFSRFFHTWVTQPPALLHSCCTAALLSQDRCAEAGVLHYKVW
jgi:hypothetical protein